MTPSIQTIRGATRLTFDSVEAVTNIVENMHETIAEAALPLPGKLTNSRRAHGLIATGVYSVVRGINSALGKGAEYAFDLAPRDSAQHSGNKAEIKFRAAMNGAVGDHLEASGNSLAIPMALMTPEQPLSLNPDALKASLPAASPHLVVIVHGLCLSELSWSRNGGACIGSSLAAAQDCTPLYLRYNTGRHISTNGQELAQLLEELCAAWPVPVQSLSLIGHSMGGLVIRSACWYADQTSSPWLQSLHRIVCLGTPHHGSPVEKAGHALDRLMQKTPFTAPLAVARGRSAGIKDLRHGNLLDEDWMGHDPDTSGEDNRRPVPLLPEVDYFFAAATIGKHESDPIGQALGDLLVRLPSAVGAHENAAHDVGVAVENCQIFHEKNHFELVYDERVHRQIIDWFNQ
jgi:pimeloyl-ACP methyl ester carboxylesterase